MGVTLQILLAASVLAIAHCKLGFDHSIVDLEFLAATDELVSREVLLSRENVLSHMKALESATTDYISIKLKENVVKTVRALMTDVVVEPLSSRRSWKKSFAQWRQEDAAEGAEEPAAASGEASGVDEDEEPATTELTGLGTAIQINQNVFKFLGDTVKILAGISGGGRPKVGKKSLLPDQYLVSAQALINERFSDQLLGLLVLLADESENLPQNQAQPLKTQRGTHLKLHNVLVNSIKQSQPLEQQLLLKDASNTDLNTYFFVETFRHTIEEILVKKVIEQAESIPDLYNGVRSSFELIKTMDALSLNLKNGE